MSKNYWSDKLVLVTGAGGFVGRRLTDFMRLEGAEVVALSRHGDKKANIQAVDITDNLNLDKLFSKYKPFACYHLAADALVEEGEAKPYQTLKNNILSALNVLELGRKYKIKRIIIASTVHVYGDNQSIFSEEDPPKPTRPYETSKTCVDVIAQSYADTFHLPVLIPRFVNLYGPGDLNYSRLIPKTIKSILMGNKPTMWGGKAVREYLFIDDAISAYDLLGRIKDTEMDRNRIYNFGSPVSISVEKLIERIIKISGKRETIQKISGGREEEIPVQKVNWDKAKRVLGWEPKVDINNGLMKTFLWYQSIINNNYIKPNRAL